MAKSDVRIVPDATITTFDDLVAEEALIVEAGVYTGDARIVRDKRELEGKRFLITGWELRDGNNTFVDGDGVVRARQYVSVLAALDTGKGKTPERIVFNDGGSGIRPVLEQHEEKTGHRGGILCKGLRSSEYTYTNPETGASSAARTFYLD